MLDQSISTKFFKIKTKDSCVKTVKTLKETQRSIALILDVISKLNGQFYSKKTKISVALTKGSHATIVHLSIINF